VKPGTLLILLLGAGLLLPGCATDQRQSRASLRPGPVESTALGRLSGLSAEVKTRILSLDPALVTERDVREVLSRAPAPRIISIHGGLFPIKSGMNSFARFLIGMGYPETSIQNPGNGSYTYGYYDHSDRIAGAVAWHYERDGLRPMIVGHSQGGMQAIRVLHKLAGDSATRLPVWNPVTECEEPRHEITDPLTGTTRPVVGLQVSYATAAVAGGLARLLPNEWDMNGRLRKIPDSVEEFTGFQKGFDLLGGDFLGYGSANDYHPMGTAIVRNVRLPSACAHSTIPYAQSLLKSPEIRDWIANYEPIGQTVDAPEPTPRFGLKNARILWAAEVWHGIKKHWVLELQRAIRAEKERPSTSAGL
jgi:hypothetical protein